MKTIHWLHPERLVLLVGWIVLLGWYFYSKVQLRKQIPAYYALFAGLALLIIALSQPQWGSYVSHQTLRSGNLYLLFDLSRSMEATDIKPSRFEFAKRWVRDFLSAVPQMKVALMPFTSQGYVQVPLSHDNEAILESLDSWEPKLMLLQGTHFNPVLSELRKEIANTEERFLKEQKEWPPPQVLLVSDGESHTKIDPSLLLFFQKKKIPFFCLGVGTRSGANIETSPSWQFREFAPTKKTISRLEESVLRFLSQETGGKYFYAKTTEPKSVIPFLIQNQNDQRKSSQFVLDRDLYPYFSWVGFTALMLWFIRLRWKEVLFAGLSFILFNSHAYGADDSLTKYNRSIELIKKDNWSEAARLLEEVVQTTDNPEIKKKALYNLGNYYFNALDFAQSLEHYQQAYSVPWKNAEEASTNQRISENITLVAQILERLKQNAQGQGKSKGQGASDQDQKGPRQFMAESISDQEKKNLFDAIKQEEQQSFEREQLKKSGKSDTSQEQTPW